MRIVAAFLLVGPLAFAQLDSNSVTVTASRAATLQADQVVFGVTVGAPMEVSLNDVVAALQSAGITLSNFVGANTQGIIPGFIGPQQLAAVPVQWTFALPVAVSKLTDTASVLKNLQQNVLTNNKTWTMSFSVQGTQVSLPLQQSQVCSLPDLLNDARVQAQKMASAAGMTLGNVLAMSSGTSTTQQGSGVYVGTSLAGFVSSTQFLPPQVCSATVKFALR
jgi:hypothetical protein